MSDRRQEGSLTLTSPHVPSTQRGEMKEHTLQNYVTC